ELVFAGAIFGKYTHGGATAVGIFQAVHGHVVIHGGVTVSVAFAAFQQQVGSIAHAFLTAGHHHVHAACLEQVVGKHGGFQTGTAHFMNGGASYTLGQTNAQGSLACRSLALTGLQHVTHDHFVDFVGLNA